MVTLGEKIKTLRTKRKISQFSMETDLELGYGSVSRIESGQTYPTNKTLQKIVKYFKLDDREIDYLIGTRSQIATLEEINAVIERTKDIWIREDVFVLLRDDRFRICAASEGLRKAFGVDKYSWLNRVFLKNIVEIVLDSTFSINKAFNQELNPNAAEELKSILYAFYHETKSMFLEENYLRTINIINHNSFAKKIWDEINNEGGKNLYLLISNKHVCFDIGNKIIKMAFYTEGIPDSPKFSYLEFFPYPFSNPQTTPHSP